MACKKRRIQLEGIHISEDRVLNKVVDDVTDMRSNITELKKMIKVLLVQIKFQNNKINSLEEKINQNSENSEMLELKEMICQMNMNNESSDPKIQSNSGPVEDFSYIS